MHEPKLEILRFFPCDQQLLHVKFSTENETALFWISGKVDNLRGVPKFWEMQFLISVPNLIFLQFFELFVFWKFKNFWILWKFSQEICTRFDIFGIGWMENAPRLSKVCEIQNWNFHEYKIWAISQKILLSKCNRLQNSRTSTFCERERRGQYSNGRPGASEETATRGSS